MLFARYSTVTPSTRAPITGYPRANNHLVTYTYPNPNGQYEVYVSSDGTNFSLLASLPMFVGNFSSLHEIHCWAYPINSSIVLVSDTQDNNTASTLYVYNVNGTLIAEKSGLISHDTDAYFIVDGNFAVCGGEDCLSRGYCDVKLVELPIAVGVREVSPFLILPLFISATLLAAIVQWKKAHAPSILARPL